MEVKCCALRHRQISVYEKKYKTRVSLIHFIIHILCSGDWKLHLAWQKQTSVKKKKASAIYKQTCNKEEDDDGDSLYFLLGHSPGSLRTLRLSSAKAHRSAWRKRRSSITISADGLSCWGNQFTSPQLDTRRHLSAPNTTEKTLKLV